MWVYFLLLDFNAEVSDFFYLFFSQKIVKYFMEHNA